MFFDDTLVYCNTVMNKSWFGAIGIVIMIILTNVNGVQTPHKYMFGIVNNYTIKELNIIIYLLAARL